jgi:putative flippase GtrA
MFRPALCRDGSGDPCAFTLAQGRVARIPVFRCIRFARGGHPLPGLVRRTGWAYARAMRATLLRLIGPSRLAVVEQFLRFGTVGAMGFVVDVSVVYGLRGVLGLYGAGAAAYVAAATFTWAFNRAWTFRGPHRLAMHRQWAMFLATNMVGFAVNRGLFFALVTWSAFCAAYPVVAIAAGVGAGMLLNFAVARQVVFARGDVERPES